MCKSKNEAKSKIDQLIQSMDRLANALVTNAGEGALKSDPRGLGGGASQLGTVASRISSEHD